MIVQRIAVTLDAGFELHTQLLDPDYRSRLSSSFATALELKLHGIFY